MEILFKMLVLFQVSQAIFWSPSSWREEKGFWSRYTIVLLLLLFKLQNSLQVQQGQMPWVLVFIQCDLMLNTLSLFSKSKVSFNSNQSIFLFWQIGPTSTWKTSMVFCVNFLKAVSCHRPSIKNTSYHVIHNRLVECIEKFANYILHVGHFALFTWSERRKSTNHALIQLTGLLIT